MKALKIIGLAIIVGILLQIVLGFIFGALGMNDVDWDKLFHVIITLPSFVISFVLVSRFST